jgi:Tol biopolymer transport system component
MGQPIAPWGSWTTSARWSPDGRWIVFDQANRAGGAHDLYLVHPDGSGLRRLPAAAPGIGACCARWSPDGRALVYERGPTNDRLRLWLLNLDGSGARPMSGPAAGFTFAWGR